MVLFRSLIAVLLVLAVGAPVAAQVPFPLHGTWEGNASVVSPSLGANGLRVRLVVARDGTTTGTVGDAQLVNGRLRTNRSAFARIFKLRTLWRIDGELVGPLVAADSLVAERVVMPVDLVDGQLRGDLNVRVPRQYISVRMVLSKM